ncbi:MAG: DUF1570 domain-containing protein [Phycisphaerales bacterium]|nr:DUF1570 domain-containing protein [Phycisphaerales bacterium]
MIPRLSVIAILVALPLIGCQRGGAVKPTPRPTPLAVNNDDRFNSDEAQFNDWSFLGIPGKQIRTRHWDIRTTMTSDRLRQLLPGFYEKALDRYQNAFGVDLPPPPYSLETYLFADRRQWKNKTRMLLPDKAASFEGLGRGGFTTDGIAVLYDIDGYGWHRDTLALGAHEGWHQYVQTTFKDQLPAWLDEGVATTMEGFSWRRRGLTFRTDANRERWSRLRQCVYEDRLMPLDVLISAHPERFLDGRKQTLLDYYAQVWALTRYLAEAEDGRYRDQVGNALLLAASGDLYRQLLRSEQLSDEARARIEDESDAGLALLEFLVGPDIDGFQDRFHDWSRSLVGAATSRES